MGWGGVWWGGHCANGPAVTTPEPKAITVSAALTELLLHSTVIDFSRVQHTTNILHISVVVPNESVVNFIVLIVGLRSAGEFGVPWVVGGFMPLSNSHLVRLKVANTIALVAGTNKAQSALHFWWSPYDYIHLIGLEVDPHIGLSDAISIHRQRC